MNDYLMLNDLFKNEQDSIGFQLFKKSNINKLNNNNNGNYNNKQIEFNTLNISNKIINYSKVDIELELMILVKYDNDDKVSVHKKINLKNSYEIIKSLRIMLNNTIVSNENYINRSNLVNHVLNNGKSYPISHRNLDKADESLSITDNSFISYTSYASDNTKKHEITFKIPVYLKDISNYFKNIGLINFGEFHINLSLINKIISISDDQENSYKIKNAYLIVEEIQLSDKDNINYLKMLNNGYERKINFMENHVKTFGNQTIP